jgi:RHS repeat-associated protein
MFGPEPTGSFPSPGNSSRGGVSNSAANSIPLNAANGNYSHGTRDVEHPGAVGFLGLTFGRVASSRYTTEVETPMGAGGSWRHNWMWSVRRELDGANKETIEVQYPDGARGFYTKATPTSLFLNELGADRSERIEVDAANDRLYRLYFEDGTSLTIMRYGSYISGTEFLAVTQVVDRFGLAYQLLYDAQHQLVRVTDPSGKYLQLTYSNVGVHEGDIASYTFSLTDADFQSFYESNINELEYVPQTVTVAGDFNGWDHTANPLNGGGGSDWSLTLPLQVGTYSYVLTMWGYYITSSQVAEVTVPDPALSDNAQDITFEIAGSATSMQLAGSFNNWQGQTMVWNATDQVWRLTLTLNPGEYVYKFIKNGTIWLTDPHNPFLQSNGNGGQNSVLVVGNVVKKLTSVQAFNPSNSTAVAQVNYGYEVFSSGPVVYAALKTVTYPDGTVGDFTYAQPQFWAGRPLLATVNDPRHENKMLDRVGFTYRDDFDGNAPLEGFIHNVYSLDTNELLVELDHNDAGDELQMTYMNGKQEHIKLNAFDFPTFHHRNSTGTPVEATERFANGAGMIQRTIDATGRITEFERTAEFGRTSVVHQADGTTVSSAFTNADKPFFTSAKTLTYPTSGGTANLATTYVRNAQGRVTQVNHPDGTYETYEYNALGQVTFHRAKDGVTQFFEYDTSLKTLLASRLGSATSTVGHTQFFRDSRSRVDKVHSATINNTSNSLVTNLTYDDANRIIGKNYYDSVTPSAIIVGESYTYNARGLLTSKVDGRGKTWNYQNDAFGRVTVETDPTNKTTFYQYFGGGGGNSCGCGGGSGGPLAIVTPDNATTSFQYDLEGRRIQTTRGAGSSVALTSYQEYDALGRPSVSTNEYGVETTREYDPLTGQLIYETVGAPFNHITAYEYDGMGNVVQITFPDDSYEVKGYDAFGRLLHTSRFEAAGTLVNKRSQTYNALGQIDTTKDGNNNITTYVYDGYARRENITRPDGRTQSFVYDNAGQLMSSINFIGSVSANVYDIFGRVATKVTDGVYVAYGYENKPSGLLLTEQLKNTNSILASTTTYTYDNAGRQLNVLQNGITTTRQYFTPDARSTTTLVGTRSTIVTVDLVGRTSQTKDGLSRATNYTYVKNAGDHTLTTTVTNPAGKADVSVQDGLGRTISTKNANNEITTYQYDALSRNTAYTNAKTATFSFTYNAVGQRTRRTEPDTTYQTYQYDLAGNLTQHRKADGSIATITYTNLNRPDYKSWSGSTEYTNWSYDSLGRLDGIENQDSLTSYTYATTTTDRIESESSNVKGLTGYAQTSTARSYDTFNRLYQLTAYAAATPIDQIVYNYYAAGNPREGLLQSINNDGPPPLATYSYDTSGLVQTIALENNITTTWTRDAAYQTTSYLANNTSNSTVSGVTHGYDDASRRKYAQYEDNLGQAYSYDDAGQVTNAKVNIANPATTSATTSPTHSYDYDAVGNRNSSLAFGTTTNYTANNVNAYTAITGFAAPIHDANGNMTSGPLAAGAATLTFDKENRLRSAVCNGVTTYYTYDALSRLLSVDQPNSSGAPTKEIYTWSSWTMLARAIYTSGSLTETFRYTWGLDLSGSLEGAGGVGGLLAIERNGAGSTTWDIRYAHNDANGNVSALTDSTGNVSARYRYDAFGNTLSATDVDSSGWVNHNIHRFSSKPSFGTTGLLFYGYRWYTPRDARWINRDPIEEEGGMNLYGFVGNDGVGKWDYLGYKCTEVADSFRYITGWKMDNIELIWDTKSSADVKLLDEIKITWKTAASINCCCGSSYYRAQDYVFAETTERGFGVEIMFMTSRNVGSSPGNWSNILGGLASILTSIIGGNWPTIDPSMDFAGQFGDLVRIIKETESPKNGNWANGKSPCEKYN